MSSLCTNCELKRLLSAGEATLRLSALQFYAGAHAMQVERLQRKFAMIHSTLAQQQNPKPGPDTPRMQSSHSQAENLAKVRALTLRLGCVSFHSQRDLYSRM